MDGGPSPGLRFPGQCIGKDLKNGSSEPDSMLGDGRDFRRCTLNPGLKQLNQHFITEKTGTRNTEGG